MIQSTARSLRLVRATVAALWLACAAGSPAAFAQARIPQAFPDLDSRIRAVLPTPEEDAFLRIPWRLNVMQARAESLRTGKPMFLWEMNGHPLGHT